MNNVAIHEAGHAVGFLAYGRMVDSIILDGDGRSGRVMPHDAPKSIKSEAVIDLAGLMAEHIAYERGVIDTTPEPLPAFNRVAGEEKTDDESKYRSNVYTLQRAKPIATRKGIDLALKREARDLIERHWSAVLKIADAICSAPERPNVFSHTNEKCLDGAVVEEIFKWELVEM